MSADGLKVDLQDGILTLRLANPPLNDLSPGLRSALFSVIDAPPAGCRAIVLGAEGPHFSGLLPVEDAQGSPTLVDLCRAVETSAVPVVAVLHGVVTGPGAELALAARARLADPSLRLAFAEVTLGLSPLGGTTRRSTGAACAGAGTAATGVGLIFSAAGGATGFSGATG